jgi:hypothetical protein
MNSLDKKDQTSNPALDNEIDRVLKKLIVGTQDLDFKKAHPNTRQHHVNKDKAKQAIKSLFREEQLRLAKHFAFHFGISEEEVIKVLGDMK